MSLLVVFNYSTYRIGHASKLLSGTRICTSSGFVLDIRQNMGKARLKATKCNPGDNKPVHVKKGDSKPAVAGGQPEVQGGATGEQLGHRLGLAFSTAKAGIAKTKKEKRSMRHEAFIRKLEAGKIVKHKRRKKKACVPKTLDLKNLVDALPAVVERTAVKPGEKDMKHLERVVNHPQFQANPIDAVLNHLRQAYKS
ncbi:uncharacterized protein LOC142566730 isoform X3 [Dermacentor variabilis]|uniref:uncharacterized protein LOC142566730 isoform X3 n=1 Tax=Dermacentor variabilis TaxID=34621 RepID=UPI003F5C22B8